MICTRAKMQTVTSNRAGRENMPGHIHCTEHPNLPLAAGSVGVRVGSSYILKDPGSVL